MGFIIEDVTFLGYGCDLVHGTLVRPREKQVRHGIIVLGDAFGLSDHFRDVAQRLARAGYAALVMDIFSRTGPPDAQPVAAHAGKIAAFLDRLPDLQVLGDIRSAVAWLRRRPDSSGRVGCIGFCLGGIYTQMALTVAEGPDVGVDFYGRLRYSVLSATKPLHPIDRAPETRGPLLALFGGQDPLIPRAHVESLRRALAKSGRPFRIHIYPDAGHAFFDDRRPDQFCPRAAADAWKRTLGWFAQHLGTVQPSPGTQSRNPGLDARER
jgi:carboxymethylenebutenolidase